MHSDLTTLIELQSVDLKLEALTRQMEAVPAEIEALEAQLAEFLHAHDERQKQLAANQKQRRDLEGDIQEIRAKISKHKDQLYQVKTNDQYRAMLKEIEGEESNIRKVEDKVLEQMIAAEELQKLVGESSARLEAEKARVAAEKKRLEALRESNGRERGILMGQREELQSKLSEGVGDLYERMRRARHGLAVAEARDGLCTACNVLLRPQLYNEVRANETVHTCENCNRILYYREPPPAESEASGEPAAVES